MTMRNDVNQSLRKLMTENQDVILLGQSIRDPYGGVMKCTRGLTKDFDGRIIDTPICEVGMTGIAIGLAMQGYIPILEIMFSDFITLCYDQLYNMLGKIHNIHDNNIKLIIRTMQNDDELYGVSHSQNMYEVIDSLNQGKYPCGTNIIYARENYYEVLLNAIEWANPLSVIIENKDLYGR